MFKEHLGGLTKFIFLMVLLTSCFTFESYYLPLRLTLLPVLCGELLISRSHWLASQSEGHQMVIFLNYFAKESERNQVEAVRIRNSWRLWFYMKDLNKASGSYKLGGYVMKDEGSLHCRRKASALCPALPSRAVTAFHNGEMFATLSLPHHFSFEIRGSSFCYIWTYKQNAAPALHHQPEFKMLTFCHSCFRPFVGVFCLFMFLFFITKQEVTGP